MKDQRRRIMLILPYIVLAGFIALAINFRNQKEGPQVKEETDEIREVPVTSVANSQMFFNLNVQGELTAYDKVEIYAEVGGLMLESSRPFKKGVYFPAGSVLANIDKEEARLSLLSQKASFLNSITQIMPDLKIDYPESFEQWQSYLNDFQMDASIIPLPEPRSEQERYFIASRNLYTQFYNIQSAESRLSKYTIQAPFNGVLTEALVQTGTVIRTGQKLGTFMRTGTYELEARIPVSDIRYVSVGDKLTLQAIGVEGSWEGTVRRISDQIDRGSQTVPVFIGVNGVDLKEGMYLKGQLPTTRPLQAVAVPQSLLINGEAILIIEEGKLVSRPVEILRIDGDQAFIRGLEDGTVILKQPVPGTYPGLEVRPRNEPATPTAAAEEDENSDS